MTADYSQPAVFLYTYLQSAENHAFSCSLELKTMQSLAYVQFF